MLVNDSPGLFAELPPGFADSKHILRMVLPRGRWLGKARPLHGRCRRPLVHVSPRTHECSRHWTHFAGKFSEDQVLKLKEPTFTCLNFHRISSNESPDSNLLESTTKSRKKPPKSWTALTLKTWATKWVWRVPWISKVLAKDEFRHNPRLLFPFLQFFSC